MGTIILKLRKEKNMTQIELANKLNVTDKAVSKWERGISCPDLNTIPQLAEILEISPNELMGYREQADNGMNLLEQKEKVKNIVQLVLKAVGMAMGVVRKVYFNYVGVGLTCFGIVFISEYQEK